MVRTVWYSREQRAFVDSRLVDYIGVVEMGEDREAFFAGIYKEWFERWPPIFEDKTLEDVDPDLLEWRMKKRGDVSIDLTLHALFTQISCS
jgi:hypothetical protein